MPDPIGTGSCRHGCDLRGTECGRPPVSAFASTDRRALQVPSPDFGGFVGICRGRNSELVRTLRLALLSNRATILKVKSGGRPDGYRNAEEGIDAVGDMVSWGGHVCLLYETREEAHLPGRRGH
jgi:hypothetical protein